MCSIKWKNKRKILPSLNSASSIFFRIENVHNARSVATMAAAAAASAATVHSQLSINRSIHLPVQLLDTVQKSANIIRYIYHFDSTP